MARSESSVRVKNDQYRLFIVLGAMKSAAQDQFHATQEQMSAMLSATQDQIAVAQEQMSTIQIENRESLDEVMVRLEHLETAPIIQAVTKQDLNPHSKAHGVVASPATVPIPLSQDIPDTLRRSIRLSGKLRPKYKELSSRVRWQESPSLGPNPRRWAQRSASSYSPTALQQRDGLPADESTLATSGDGVGTGTDATVSYFHHRNKINACTECS